MLALIRADVTALWLVIPGQRQWTPRTLIGSPPIPLLALPCTVAKGLVRLCAALVKRARPIVPPAIGCLQIKMHSRYTCVPVQIILGIVSNAMLTWYARQTMSYVLNSALPRFINLISSFIPRPIKSAFTLCVEDVRLRPQHLPPLLAMLLESCKVGQRTTGDDLWYLGAKKYSFLHRSLFRFLRDARQIQLRPISSPPHHIQLPVVSPRHLMDPCTTCFRWRPRLASLRLVVLVRWGRTGPRIL